MSSWHDKNAKAWQNSFKYFQSESYGFTNESNLFKETHLSLYLYSTNKVTMSHYITYCHYCVT